MSSSRDLWAVRTDEAPSAIGPYSQAVVTPTLLFASGQIGLNPSSGQLVQGGVAAQTRQVLLNLECVLNAANCSLGDVIKTTVFLTDMNDFSEMNAVYAEFFADLPPARSTVGVSSLPKGALIEIEAVALVRSRKPD
jgi:2-iminobutanoate/2-iminopropanoate deaminase